VKLWDKYADDVVSGRRLTGNLERLAAERYLSLRKNDRYNFDVQEVEEKLHVISLLKHTKGSFKGKPFNVLPWQAFFWAYIFGFKHKDDNLRVVREVLLCMAKKGGKSEVGGATGVLMTFLTTNKVRNVTPRPTHQTKQNFHGQPERLCANNLLPTMKALAKYAGFTTA
jgi:phage terminase large subunit-like protein